MKQFQFSHSAYILTQTDLFGLFCVFSACFMIIFHEQLNKTNNMNEDIENQTKHE